MGEQVYTETIVVSAPAESVWDVLADVARWPEWTASMRDVQLLDAPPLRAGLRVRIKQPRLPQVTWTVQDVVPVRSFSWAARSGGVHTVADHRLDPTPDGTRVTLELRQSVPLAGVFHRLFGGLTQRYMRMEAEGLKRRAESGH
jgi:uncharacterized membrane protein